MRSTILSSLISATVIVFLSGCNDPNSSGKIEVNQASESTAAKEAFSAPSGPDIGWPNVYGPSYNSTSAETNVLTRWPASGPIVKWTRPTGAGYSAPVSVGDETVTIFRKADEEVVECLNTRTGELKWEHRYSSDFKSKYDYSNGPYSTPVISQQSVITISAAGQINCLSRDSGDVRWSRDLFNEYEISKRDWPFAGSPLLLEDRLILNLGAAEQEAGIVAIDLAEGKTIWEATTDGYAHTTPTIATIHGQRLVFVLTFEGLVCLDPEDGTVHWQIAHQVRDPTGMNGTNAVSPIVIDDRVCVVSGPKVKPGLRCFRVLPDGTYDEPWRDIRLLKSQYTNLVGVNGYLFAFTPMTVGGPTMKCIDVINGKLAWKGKPDLGRGNMLAVNDSIIILGEDGTLASFELNTSKLIEISRTDQPVLEKPCYTSLALNQGLLFARNEKQLICFDLRRSTPKTSDSDFDFRHEP